MRQNLGKKLLLSVSAELFEEFVPWPALDNPANSMRSKRTREGGRSKLSRTANLPQLHN